MFFISASQNLIYKGPARHRPGDPERVGKDRRADG